MPDALRILVAEDEILLREGLVRLLEEAGFDVVGQAGTAEEAIHLADRLRPDVALLDIRMPPTRTDEGMRVAEVLDQQRPDIGLLLLSHHVEAIYATRLLDRRTRAVGYLLKDRVTDLDRFAEAVRRIASGGVVVDSKVVDALMGRRRAGDPLGELSARERELLGLMAEGRTNQAIAETLFLSPKTIETHVRSIFMKLDLSSDVADNRRVLAVLRYLSATRG